MGEVDGFVPALQETELQDGEMKLVRLEGTPILLIKQSGKIFAIDNRCPHMGCGFSGGTLDGLVVVCPCHDWRFNLESGEYEDDPSYKLKSYEWQVRLAKFGLNLKKTKTNKPSLACSAYDSLVLEFVLFAEFPESF